MPIYEIRETENPHMLHMMAQTGVKIVPSGWSLTKDEASERWFLIGVLTLRTELQSGVVYQATSFAQRTFQLDHWKQDPVAEFANQREAVAWLQEECRKAVMKLIGPVELERDLLWMFTQDQKRKP